jgi:hypothetical protein
MFEPLSPVVSEGALTPITEIAFYNGLQHGYYFGFQTSFTAFMIPLCLVGFAAWLYNVFEKEDELNLNRRLLPFTCLFTSLWMAIFFHAWKRREKVLSYKFQTLGAKENKTASKDFSG